MTSADKVLEIVLRIAPGGSAARVNALNALAAPNPSQKIRHLTAIFKDDPSTSASVQFVRIR